MSSRRNSNDTETPPAYPDRPTPTDTPPPPPFDPPHPQGTFGTTYAAEYLGMPVSATVLSISTSDPMAAVWSTASARLLRRSATSELRSLASHVPPHPRLARTHGNESVSAQAPLRVVNGDGGKEEPVALVLVGEMVEGGSLRGRLKSAGGAAAAAAEEGEEEAAGGGVAGEKAGVEAAPSASTSKGAGSSEEGAPTTPKASAPPQALRHRRVLADVAQGLAFLHERGVSHGALTADNVLLDAEGRAKVWAVRRRSRAFDAPSDRLLDGVIGSGVVGSI